MGWRKMIMCFGLKSMDLIGDQSFSNWKGEFFFSHLLIRSWRGRGDQLFVSVVYTWEEDNGVCLFLFSYSILCFISRLIIYQSFFVLKFLLANWIKNIYTSVLSQNFLQPDLFTDSQTHSSIFSFNTATSDIVLLFTPQSNKITRQRYSIPKWIFCLSLIFPEPNWSK